MLRVDEALRALAEEDRPLPADELIRGIEERLAGRPVLVPATQPPPPGDSRSGWRRPLLVAAAAVITTLVLVGGIALTAFRGQVPVVDDEPPVVTTFPTTRAPATTVAPTSSAPVATTLTPSPVVPVVPVAEPVAAGFDCGYLAELGLDYRAAMAYWVREGRPSRMDADGNTIPCEGDFPQDEIETVIHFDAAAPGPGPSGGSGDGGPLGAGLSCADLADLGYGFSQALAYWVRSGAPPAMDADGNGLPCETAYAWADVEAVMGFDGTPYRSPPPLLAGWAPTDLAATVTPPDGDLNATGPASPPLPPPEGGFPHDGSYAAAVEREAGADHVTLRLRRWIPCSAAPDQCLDPMEGDLTVDQSAEVTRVLPLDRELTVVIHPIFLLGDPTIGGDGVAFRELLAAFDDAYDTRLLPDETLRCPDPEKSPPDGVACPFVSLWGPNGIDAYRGPLGTYLVLLPELRTQWIDAGLPRGPGGMYGWEAALVISDGKPVLHIGAGRIAG